MVIELDQSATYLLNRNPCRSIATKYNALMSGLATFGVNVNDDVTYHETFKDTLFSPLDDRNISNEVEADEAGDTNDK